MIRPVKSLPIAGIIVATGMLVLGFAVLLSARQDAWEQARQDLNNLSVSLEREVGRNIAVYDLSLQGAQNALQLSGMNDVTPEIRQAALFDQSASADGLGSLLILDKSGFVVRDSASTAPSPLFLGDRDYFKVHQANPDVGLYLSKPFRSRLRGGDPSMSISRRITTADGRFDGVVVGTLRLAYFNSLFARLNPGPNGSLALFQRDGRLVARLPQQEGDFERTLSPGSQAQKFLRTGQAEMIGRSEIDGIQRLTIFRPVAGLSLVVAVAASTDAIFAPWWRRSIAIASALVALSLAVATLSWLFSRELQSRIDAEAKALHLAAQLSRMATTDSLTGLANRRAFNERLALEWKRGLRNQTSLAAIMIDADHFKLFNDRYGHLEGDRVLTAIADCMLGAIRRPGDFAARFGGEEFVILLSETELAGALWIAEAIRSAILHLAIPHADGLLGQVSVSMGVAAIYPAHGDTSANLVGRADAMLYEAKRGGRNKVMAAPLEVARFDRERSRTG